MTSNINFDIQFLLLHVFAFNKATVIDMIFNNLL